MYISLADITLGAHKCKLGDPCTCVTPRKRNKKKGVPEFEQLNTSQAPHEPLGGHNSTTRTSSQILARIAELRPVLPRPSQDGFSNHGGPVHLPSTGISHAHASRHPEHVFKPYERAYGMTHQHPGHFQSYLVPGPSNPTFGFNDQSYNGQMMGVPTDNPWSPRQDDVGLDNSSFPSLCGCGDDCSCPGCHHHNRSTAIPASSAYSSCSNPGACGACLDCTILSLPPSAIPPPDTALSIYDSQPDAIDDWLRQMLSSTSSESFQNFPPNGAQFQQPPPQSWGTRSFPYSDQQSNIDRSPFAYGRSPPSSMAFVASGERGSDYPQRAHRPQSPMSNMDGRPVVDPRLLPPNGMAPYFGQPRSRSPSSSSQSSHQSSQDNQGNGSVPIYRPSERVQGIFPSVHGVRSTPPQMNIRHLINRGSSSATSSMSPSSGSSSRRPPYAGNSGDDSGSNPPLANLHIY